MGSEVSVSLNPAIQATRPPAPTASGLSPYSHHLPYPGHAYRSDPTIGFARSESFSRGREERRADSAELARAAQAGTRSFCASTFSRDSLWQVPVTCPNRYEKGSPSWSTDLRRRAGHGIVPAGLVRLRRTPCSRTTGLPPSPRSFSLRRPCPPKASAPQNPLTKEPGSVARLLRASGKGREGPIASGTALSIQDAPAPPSAKEGTEGSGEWYIRK